MLEKIFKEKSIVLKIKNPSFETRSLFGYFRAFHLENSAFIIAKTWKKPVRSRELDIDLDSVPENLQNIVKMSRTYYDLAKNLETILFISTIKKNCCGGRCVNVAAKMKQLLGELGIESYIIYGVVPCRDGVMRGHAWVAYREPFDGRFYPLDPTMKSHRNIPFLYTDRQIFKLPSFESAKIFLPSLTPKEIVLVKRDVNNMFTLEKREGGK